MLKNQATGNSNSVDIALNLKSFYICKIDANFVFLFIKKYVYI